jgi:hypothetical protein
MSALPGSFSSRRILSLVVIVLGLLLAGGWFYLRPHGPDPKAVAAAETRMWQAYYSADPFRLHRELTSLLEAQFALKPADAQGIAQSLAMAAYKFETSREGYEANVLPDLERAFAELRRVTGGKFDARQAAQAELAWWVARRTPGSDSARQVGQGIGEVYAILYGHSKPEFIEAGVLRAEAGRIRDQGGAGCDWQQVESLLQRSYQTLIEAI